MTADDTYVMLGIMMLMGIVQKLTIKSYFISDLFIETPIFGQTVNQDCFELIMKFLHFVDNSTHSTYTSPSGFSKILSIVENFNQCFQSAYLPGENTSIGESLLLWKGRLSFKQCLPLKASKFGIKTFELCDSLTGCVWTFFMYTGAGSNISPTIINITDNLKNAKIVVSLMEPLLKKG